MDDNRPRLEMHHVVKSFGATRALDGVDLCVHAGQVHALVGENGAGKSTLMKVLSGALVPDAGSMQLDGRPYRPRSPADGRRCGVAMIYQELSLAPHLSVLENVLLGAEPRFGPLVRWRKLRAAAAHALRTLGRSDLPLDVPVARLPLADRQMIEIARAIAVGCRVLVLDEPTSSLAAADVERLFELLSRLRGEGHAIVYISHALEEIARLADRFTVLRDGRSAGEGDPRTTPTDEIIARMVGRRVAELFPRSQRTPGEVLVDVRRLAGMRLPREAAFTLRRGEVLGIAGLVGAGRTELLRALFGLDRVRSGELRVAALHGWRRPAERWKSGVGMVSEDRKAEGLALDLAVSENLCLPRLRGLGALGAVLPGRVDAAAALWVERLGVKCASLRQPVGALSGGNQQKVAFARLLHAEVDVLLLDEPTRGIDVGAKAELYRWIDRLARGDPQRGTASRAVLMVSSYIPELLGVCDRVAVMCRGRLGPFRPARELSEHDVLREAAGSAA